MACVFWFCEKVHILSYHLIFFRKKINNKNPREVGKTCCFNFVHSSGSDNVLLVLALIIGSVYWNSAIGYLCIMYLLHLTPYVGCRTVWNKYTVNASL